MLESFGVETGGNRESGNVTGRLALAILPADS
jgi:hypothetical protein